MVVPIVVFVTMNHVESSTTVSGHAASAWRAATTGASTSTQFATSCAPPANRSRRFRARSRSAPRCTTHPADHHQRRRRLGDREGVPRGHPRALVGGDRVLAVLARAASATRRGTAPAKLCGGDPSAGTHRYSCRR